MHSWPQALRDKDNENRPLRADGLETRINKGLHSGECFKAGHQGKRIRQRCIQD